MPRGRKKALTLDEQLEKIISDITETEERLKEIVEYIEDSGPVNFYGNIGLKNVSDRLKLLYHSCSGLKFASEREGGTTITFAIAKEELR